MDNHSFWARRSEVLRNFIEADNLPTSYKDSVLNKFVNPLYQDIAFSCMVSSLYDEQCVQDQIEEHERDVEREQDLLDLECSEIMPPESPPSTCSEFQVHEVLKSGMPFERFIINYNLYNELFLEDLVAINFYHRAKTVDFTTDKYAHVCKACDTKDAHYHFKTYPVQLSVFKPENMLIQLNDLEASYTDSWLFCYYCQRSLVTFYDRSEIPKKAEKMLIEFYKPRKHWWQCVYATACEYNEVTNQDF